MKKFIQYIAAAVVFLPLFYACEDTEGVLEELGLPKTEFVVSNTAGILSVEYLANSRGSVTVVSDSPWVRMETSTFEADGTLKISYEDNAGFPRMAEIRLALDRNPEYSATLVIKQEGYEEPYFTLPKSAIAIMNGSGLNVSADINTNVPAEDITIKTRILDGDEDWISDVVLNESSVDITLTSDNLNERKRAAAISFSYDSGWGETVTTDLRITQAGSDNSFGTPVSFSQLRSKASVEGTLLHDEVLEAYVISDKASGNVNENTQLSSKSIDYTVCRRSAYIQDSDGSYGFLVLMNSEEENVFEMDTKVLLSLSEVTVRRLDNPERYILENVTDRNVIRIEDAKGQIVPKVKTIKELVPEDIYTRVTLTEVEWPIRKGSLTPCYEFMTNACNNDSATKCATLLRGKDGGSMYILTNTTCPYRRDGSRMGYGSGNITGVIVHEKHRPFVDYDGASESEHGYIGDFQIRHMAKSDIDLADDFNDGFSEMICEFRYVQPYQHYYLSATYGKGLMSHTGPDSSNYNDYDFLGLTYYDFSYLGPIGNNDSYAFGNNRGNVNGFGIILEDGTDYGNTADWQVLANTDGRGRTNRLQDGNLAWGSVKWWDYTFDRPYFWLVEFSTKGVQTDQLSMQIQMLNQCQNGYSPRFWKAEWSLSADTTDDGSWQQIGDVFTVPDVIPDSFDPATWMSAAFKPMNFELPLELLDQETVYIRIGPSENKASDRYGYANAIIGGNSSSRDNYSGGTMNYFAIRYNK